MEKSIQDLYERYKYYEEIVGENREILEESFKDSDEKRIYKYIKLDQRRKEI